MNILSILRNIPLCGDELQTIKSRYCNYDALVMKICEGIDRGRMDSSAKMQVQKQWHNACIFTGEEPITQNNSGGGVQNRVIEVEVEGKIIENGHGVSEFVRRHYGTAGQEFIEQLPDDAEIQKGYERYYKDILKRKNTSEKQAMAMAIIALADELTSEMLFEDSQADPELLYQYCKTTAEIDPSERAYSMIMDWIDQNWMKFVDLRKEDRSFERFGEIDKENNVVYVNKTILEQTLKSFEFDFNAMKKKWAASGKLKTFNDGKVRYCTRKMFACTPVNVVALIMDNLHTVTHSNL